jgi:adenosylhomocysteine nucleosidase
MKIGIMGAMPQEIDLLKASMDIYKEELLGGRTFTSGKLHGFDIVLVFSRWGKVAASSTATTLLNLYKIDFLFFTGVAGAVDSNLNVGDVVIGNKLYQHDMDARPIFSKFQIPLTEVITFSPEKNYLLQAEVAVKKYLTNLKSTIGLNKLNQFSIHDPQVLQGTIASGDQFVTNADVHEDMHLNSNEKAHAVEMEGAAVAQICEEYQKPYLIIRIISDKADGSAAVDFNDFIENISNHYSNGIVREFLLELKDSC